MSVPALSQAIPSGEYKISMLLNVSHSLLSQLDGIPSPRTHDVHKAIVACGDKQLVVYILGPVIFGIGSTIEILHHLVLPIVTEHDYRLLHQSIPLENTKFINKLLEKE